MAVAHLRRSGGLLGRMALAFGAMAVAGAAVAEVARRPTLDNAPPVDNLRARYAAAIQAVVVAHWLRPDSVQPGQHCAVLVRQSPGGQVQGVDVDGDRCDYDEAGRRLIEAAVRRAAPLPYQGYETVFDPELRLVFAIES
ncbi:MAG: cell envelope integrity protein TolA [Gammaproteobacteria bacterium]